MNARKITLLSFFFASVSALAQVVTKEDSLNAGLVSKAKSTVVSGYGQAKYERDMRYKTATVDLERVVLFIGHKFNDRISFFSEMELEHAKVAGGSLGEISMEQAFLKFNLNRDVYMVAGLFLPRIGIINENHLPTTFNGNDRPFVETFLIPSTWRELGVGIYGRSNSIPGLNYSAGIINGLNSAGFQNGSGIVEGRYEGSNATASNLAVTGALLYYIQHFRIQASAYFGGSAGLKKRSADSLELSYGTFGTPVIVNDLNVQYLHNGLSVKALGAMIQIPDADKINRAYANNTAQKMIGGYIEVGYNILRLFYTSDSEKNLTVFSRFEYMDLNYKIPENGIYNGLVKKSYLVSGITWQPVRGVSVKADYVFRTTGEPNPALIFNPFPQAPPYFNTNGFLNLGIGYSF